MNLIADEKILFESPDPGSIYCYTPAIVEGESGRLIAAFDLGGPGTEQLKGPRSDFGDWPTGNQIRILLSDDDGASWREAQNRVPMMHEILFKSGNALYLLGHSGRLVISRSNDNGESWSEPVTLEADHLWHQSAGRVDFRHGKLYVAYEQRLGNKTWPDVAPVLMSARVDADLTDRANWCFSEAFNPYPVMDAARPSGIPWCDSTPGILETSVGRIYDPGHPFYDPEDRSVLLLMRAETGANDIAAILKGVEHPDGSLSIERLRTKKGRELFYIPFPGGNLKFHFDYDPVSKLYWMVASQEDGIHCSRRRLGLYYSPDLFSWTFAGLVAVGPSENGSRHYATLLIHGDDLLVLSRSGDERAESAHNNNLVTFHRVKEFRKFAK